MKFHLLVATLVVTVLAGCASTGPAPRTKLTREEIKTMSPEILAHRRCMAGKVVSYSGSGTSLETMVNAAKSSCQTKLSPIVKKLHTYNLTPRARRNYLVAIQKTSSDAVTDAWLKAKAKANKRRRTRARTSNL